MIAMYQNSNSKARIWLVGAVLCGLAVLFALYSVCYFLWLSSTPLSDGQAARVKYNYRAWLTILVVTIASAVFFYRRHLTSKRQTR